MHIIDVVCAHKVALRGDMDAIWAMSHVVCSTRDWETRRTAVAAIESLMVKGHKGKVNAVALGPRGMVATAGEDACLKVWDSERREQTVFVEAADHLSELQCVTISMRGCIAVGEDERGDGQGGGCRVLAYDGETGGRLGVMEGHTMAVVCVDFDSGGRLLASCSLDKTVTAP